MPLRFLAAFCFAVAQLSTIGKAQTLSSDCLAIAEGPARVQFVKLSPAALTENQVQLTFIGHSTFLIESSGGIRIATDFSGNAGKVEWLPRKIDMGNLPFGVAAEREFVVKNISTEMLLLTDVQSSCHCASVPSPESAKCRKRNAPGASVRNCSGRLIGARRTAPSINT